MLAPLNFIKLNSLIVSFFCINFVEHGRPLYGGKKGVEGGNDCDRFGRDGSPPSGWAPIPDSRLKVPMSLFCQILLTYSFLVANFDK